jgi:hypothetical protein
MSTGTLLRILLWIIAALGAQFILLIVLGTWIQSRAERRNRFRIDCRRRWEQQIVAFLYEGREPTPFLDLGRAERRLFIPFLLRVLAVMAGREGAAVRRLYHQARLVRGLNRRLRSRSPRERALAALEVGTFQVEVYFHRLLGMLNDPVPFVAHTAARGLANSQRLEFASPVLDWVLCQDSFQVERQLWILEGFGPSLLTWLELRMEGRSEPDVREWILFAKLAASYRSVPHASRLMDMLQFADPELRVLAVKAIAALGYPEALPAVRPLVEDPDWVLRSQAATALGILAGAEAVPSLVELLADPVFDVRRHAAQALYRLGAAGAAALRRVAEDPAADPFARDLARERLQWEPVMAAP